MPYTGNPALYCPTAGFSSTLVVFLCCCRVSVVINAIPDPKVLHQQALIRAGASALYKKEKAHFIRIETCILASSRPYKAIRVFHHRKTMLSMQPVSTSTVSPGVANRQPTIRLWIPRLAVLIESVRLSSSRRFFHDVVLHHAIVYDRFIV